MCLRADRRGNRCRNNRRVRVRLNGRSDRPRVLVNGRESMVRCRRVLVIRWSKVLGTAIPDRPVNEVANVCVVVRLSVELGLSTIRSLRLLLTRAVLPLLLVPVRLLTKLSSSAPIGNRTRPVNDRTSVCRSNGAPGVRPVHILNICR